MEYRLISEIDNELSLIEQVFKNRGILDIDHYLNTTEKDVFKPNMLWNMREGATMLIRHISNEDDIFIQVDSDADGYTSAAALINYLYTLFPAFVKNHIKYRVHNGKEHGIILDTIPKDTKLVIIPDAGSNDLEQHALLKENGIDVLVIDHHETDRLSLDACVINNQLFDYPNKTLSGVGVVYKFCSYIDELLGVNHADKFLDLVALGIIADVMDLREYETKYLITAGLNYIRNPFLKLMVKKQEFQLKGELTPFGVAFYIAPYINAMVRMGEEKEKLLLFESMLDYKGYEEILSTKRGCKGQLETRVEQACRTCTNVKNSQTKERDENYDLIENLINKNNLLNNKILIIQLDSSYKVNKNLTGLIANQLMSKYKRPVLLLNENIHDDGSIWWEGSGRGADKSALNNFREFLNDSCLVEYAQGHASAFGVGIKNENINALIEYTNANLANMNFDPIYDVDFIYQADDIRTSDILDIAELKSVWGQGVEEPLIAIENIKVYKENIKLMSPDKNPTLKIILPNNISIIKFKSSQEEYESLCPTNDSGCITINIVGSCESNYWNGNVSAQILAKDYEISKKIEYYF